MLSTSGRTVCLELTSEISPSFFLLRFLVFGLWSAGRVGVLSTSGLTIPLEPRSNSLSFWARARFNERGAQFARRGARARLLRYWRCPLILMISPLMMISILMIATFYYTAMVTLSGSGHLGAARRTSLI